MVEAASEVDETLVAFDEAALAADEAADVAAALAEEAYEKNEGADEVADEAAAAAVKGADADVPWSVDMMVELKLPVILSSVKRAEKAMAGMALVVVLVPSKRMK